jgi:hypothetical protein
MGTAAMLRLRTERFPHRPRIRIVPIRGDLFGAEFTIERALKE